ncbi:MAG: pseudouridine-5'-phosphate glycosidase, partial [Lachnospiraceae bacterium]|nr:pseudouridine-5'-phosphate glycosidase [Lachnospiraceae bacterium]
MEYIQLSEEVKNALDKDKPIIAIETGGTFEGFAYPENENVALEVQDVVRKAGAIPAYISIMDGKVKIGMSDKEIAEYGKRRGSMAKASRREIPLILAQNCSAIMTIAATMM